LHNIRLRFVLWRPRTCVKSFWQKVFQEHQGLFFLGYETSPTRHSLNKMSDTANAATSGHPATSVIHYPDGLLSMEHTEELSNYRITTSHTSHEQEDWVVREILTPFIAESILSHDFEYHEKRVARNGCHIQILVVLFYGYQEHHAASDRVLAADDTEAGRRARDLRAAARVSMRRAILERSAKYRSHEDQRLRHIGDLLEEMSHWRAYDEVVQRWDEQLQLAKQRTLDRDEPDGDEDYSLDLGETFSDKDS